jgi:HAD superfamily hydrolase (TIGR01459 family)
MIAAPLNIAGMSAIAELFDTFFLDQFGVLHNGTAPYPGVLDCLGKLKRAGKKIVILSNSGKRSADNEKRLETLGLAPSLWHVFVSSGEVAWRQLSLSGAAQTCYLISRDNDRSAIEGLSVQLASAPDNADVILLTASEGDHFELSHYEALLAEAARREIPCLCTNPDRIMLTPSGPKFWIRPNRGTLRIFGRTCDICRQTLPGNLRSSHVSTRRSGFAPRHLHRRQR